MKIFFLGTNGWFSTKEGSTPCIAIAIRERLIVLDAGDGIAKLAPLMKRLGLKRADIFLSHMHLDHSAGLHMLMRLPKGARIRVFVHKGYLPALKRLVARPYTVSPRELLSKVSFHPLKAGESRLPYKAIMLPLAHADQCFGFCFSLDGKEIAYCTDTGPCGNFGKIARNAGLLITECTLLPGEKCMAAWPHLSPELAAREAKKAGVKRLILTHFDATKYNAASLRKHAQKAARKTFPRTTAARDWMEIGI
jgi:ribonuclease BN (tRNA processing enzyme)